MCVCDSIAATLPSQLEHVVARLFVRFLLAARQNNNDASVVTSVAAVVATTPHRAVCGVRALAPARIYLALRSGLRGERAAEGQALTVGCPWAAVRTPNIARRPGTG